MSGVRLTWYGTAALLMETTVDGGIARIAFDPFTGIAAGASLREAAVPEAAAAEAFRRASDIFVTHGHFDHIVQLPAIIGGAPSLETGSIPRIHCTRAPYATLRRHGVPREVLRPLKPGGVRRVGPFTVKAYQSRHCQFDAEMILRKAFSAQTAAHPLHLLRLLALNHFYPENGETLFYEVVACGVRVQIMGSLGLAEDVDYPTGADALVMAFQGRSDLTAYALPLVERLRPGRICLDHYDDSFPPMSSTISTVEFAEKVRRRYGISAKALKKGEAVTIAPGAL